MSDATANKGGRALPVKLDCLVELIDSSLILTLSQQQPSTFDNRVANQDANVGNIAGISRLTAALPIGNCRVHVSNSCARVRLFEETELILRRYLEQLPAVIKRLVKLAKLQQ
jgi:hypothetical protein